MTPRSPLSKVLSIAGAAALLVHWLVALIRQNLNRFLAISPLTGFRNGASMRLHQGRGP